MYENILEKTNGWCVTHDDMLAKSDIHGKALKYLKKSSSQQCCWDTKSIIETRNVHLVTSTREN